MQSGLALIFAVWYGLRFFPEFAPDTEKYIALLNRLIFRAAKHKLKGLFTGAITGGVACG